MSSVFFVDTVLAGINTLSAVSLILLFLYPVFASLCILYEIVPIVNQVFQHSARFVAFDH